MGDFRNEARLEAETRAAAERLTVRTECMSMCYDTSVRMPSSRNLCDYPVNVEEAAMIIGRAEYARGEEHDDVTVNELR